MTSEDKLSISSNLIALFCKTDSFFWLYIHRPTQLGPKKCSVYLYLQWLGNVSMRYEMQNKTVVKRCYFTVEPCIVYTTRQLLTAAKKDVLPALHQSNIVY